MSTAAASIPAVAGCLWRRCLPAKLRMLLLCPFPSPRHLLVPTRARPRNPSSALSRSPARFRAAVVSGYSSLSSTTSGTTSRAQPPLIRQPLPPPRRHPVLTAGLGAAGPLCSLRRGARSVVLMRDKLTGHSRRFGFVESEDEEAAAKALGDGETSKHFICGRLAWWV